MKDDFIGFRISRNTKNEIKKIASFLELPISKLAEKSFILLINEFKNLPEDTKDLLLREIKRQGKYKDVIAEWKQYSRNGYLLKNTAKNILDKANTQMFFSGSVNMVAVKKEIKYAEKIYNLFDEESKKIFLEDMKTIKKFENKIYLMEKLQQINKITRMLK